MKKLLLIALLCSLSGCGIESVTATAAIAKVEAESAKQAKDKMEQLKTDLNAASKLNADRLKLADSPENIDNP